MKLLKALSLAVITLISANLAKAQCTVTITPSATTAVCGDSVNLVALGLASAPALQTDFNGNQLGVGWSSSATLVYNNPCGPSLDGTPSAWFGNVPFPRTLTTNGFDVSCGGQVCFDLDFAGDDPCGGCVDCEDPDLPAEGVYFQYSINNGATWVDIFYFDANSANTLPWYDWDNYCFDIPAAAWTANTMFQWKQIDPTDEQYDHWGIDNVVITPSDCGYYYNWSHIPGEPDTSDINEIIMTSSTFEVLYTNGTNDSCTTTIDITMEPFVVNALAANTSLNCGECTDLNAILTNPNNYQFPNYTYSWTPTTDLDDPNIQQPNACPTDNITYSVTITDSNTGCSGTDDVDISVAGGGAVADFTVFPSTSGCPPFDVQFTNNSVGVSYEWDFGDGNTSTTTDPSHTFTNPGTYTVELISFLPGAGCINYDTAYIDITVGNAIVPNADFDYSYECGVTAISAWNTGTPGLSYDWDMGDGNTYTNTDSITHNYASTGSYDVTITAYDAICGTSSSYTVTINVVDNPITYIFNDPTCYQFSDGSITVNLVNNTGNETFEISNAAGNIINVGGSNAANQLNGGWYYIFVDLGFGCTAEDSVLLNNPDELLPNLITTDVPCNGDNTGIAIVDTVYGWQGSYNQLAFFWSPAVGNPNGIGADTVSNLPAGTYSLTINDGNGCSNQIDFTINQPPPLVFSELGSDPAYCRVFDYQIGNGVVWASASGGTPDYDYVWFNMQDSSATSYTTWGALNPGQYQITVVDNNGCVLQEIITVDEVSPIADFTMTSGEFTANYEGTAPVSVHFENNSQFFANPNNPNADTTFYWHFNYPNDPPGWVVSHDVNETFDTTYTVGGTYTVCLVALNKNGCSDTLCEDIIIYDPLGFTPTNVFTPNGDGDNDVFMFPHQAVSTFSCVIVNRWGTTVKEFTGIDDYWDGKDKNGSQCHDGVYFYTYEGVADNGTEFFGQGTITILGTP
ncbi:PKD domain-containing protein [Paracrocinitomix mangrovi]|uniref:PKD domain-containing protein n=1 Tax=Paracrocinitomix mangrovi TaxID=2862509 RepID=UPI001C8EC079|nr:PKD domain-containing protein [Paracrocinitomix mangrovi]UKN03054.1 PKD domain-containing protein [Paracrocinitomix mangrovi]